MPSESSGSLETRPVSDLEQACADARLLHQAGCFDEAERRYLDVLAQWPDHPEANHNLGVLCRQKGRASLGYFLAALNADPASRQYWLSYIGALLDSDQPRLASEVMAIALQHGLDGDDADALSRRIDERLRPAADGPGREDLDKLLALYAGGEYREALAAAQAMTQRYPKFGFGWRAQGELCRLTGDSAAALVSLQQAVALSPEDADARNDLGIVLGELGRIQDAKSSFRIALRLNPDLAPAHYNLGNALRKLDRLDEAGASYRNALAISPDLLLAHGNLANVLAQSNRPDEAEQSYLRALALEPGYGEALLGLGNLYKDQGRIVEARALYLRALAGGQDSLKVRYNLALTGKVAADDENFAEFVKISRSQRSGAIELSREQMIWLHFALGKCYDDIADYPAASVHFSAGCGLKRAGIVYDPDDFSGQVSRIIRLFSKEMLARLCGSGDPSDVPVFILGMPRSGTTLTEHILASHPDVYGAGELSDLMDIAGQLGQRLSDTQLDPAALRAWGGRYAAGLKAIAPHALRVTDKMPANFLAMGLIHLMLPNAKIIHVRRSPADTCLSCYTQLFTDGQEYSYDLNDLARYYVDYARLMDHWRSVLPAGAFLEVDYEAIVADQHALTRRIVEYCGLQWRDECIDYYKSDRDVRTASAMQVRQPLYTSSVGRWKNYRELLAPLLVQLGDLAPEPGAR